MGGVSGWVGGYQRVGRWLDRVNGRLGESAVGSRGGWARAQTNRRQCTALLGADDDHTIPRALRAAPEGGVGDVERNLTGHGESVMGSHRKSWEVIGSHKKS